MEYKCSVQVLEKSQGTLWEMRAKKFPGHSYHLGTRARKQIV